MKLNRELSEIIRNSVFENDSNNSFNRSGYDKVIISYDTIYA